MEDIKDDNLETEKDEIETEEEKEPKTYSESDFNKRVDEIVSKKIDEWKKKEEQDKEEAKILAKMSKEDKAKHEFEKKLQDFEAREKVLVKKELEIETDNQLRELNISTKATKWVIGEDAETTHKNIKEFSLFVQDLKEELKKELLRGKTPRAAINKDNVITKEEFNKMSVQQQLEIYNSNKELYNMLTK